VRLSGKIRIAQPVLIVSFVETCMSERGIAGERADSPQRLLAFSALHKYDDR
jgi:hypothetical protein